MGMIGHVMRTADAAGPGLLGIDVGGTSVKARLVAGDGSELGRWRRPTPRGDADGRRTVEVIGEIAALAGQSAAAMPHVGVIAGAGVVVPGLVDAEAGLCVEAVNLGWQDLPLRDLLTASLGMPMAFGHDVRAGALAEARTGAAAGEAGVCAFVPVGTGVAAAYTLHGRLLGLGDTAGEVGQIVLRHGAEAGLRVEEVASASAIARRAGAADARAAVAAVRAGKVVARAAWSAAVAALADALAWTSAVLGARIVVLGGGLSLAGDILFDPLRAGLAERMGELAPPDLRAAVHGDSAAIVGAVMLAGDLLGVDPYATARQAPAPAPAPSVPGWEDPVSAAVPTSRTIGAGAGPEAAG